MIYGDDSSLIFVLIGAADRFAGLPKHEKSLLIAPLVFFGGENLGMVQRCGHASAQIGYIFLQFTTIGQKIQYANWIKSRD